MKIYIVTTESFPNGMAATNRIHAYAKGISGNGILCEVVIIKRTERYIIRNKNCNGDIDSYSFHYIPKTTVRSSNFFMRKINDLLDRIHAYQYLRRKLNKGDIVIFYGYKTINELMAIRAAKRSDAIILRELCEYPFNRLGEECEKDRRYKYLVKRIFPKYNGFLTISHALYQFANKVKTASSKVLLVPIMYNKSKFKIEQDTKFCPVKPFLFHGGTITERKDGLLEAIEGFAIATQKMPFPIYYYLAGDYNNSPIKKEIMEIVDKYSIKDRIFFLGQLKYTDSLRILSDADLIVLNKKENIQNHYGFSTKLSEYLYFAKPVIMTNTGEANYYLKDDESAYILTEGTAELIAEKIVEALSDKEKSKKIGLAGREIAIKEFDCDYQGKRIVDFLKSF